MNKMTGAIVCAPIRSNQINDKKLYILCQGCQAVHYCSNACMRKHLKQHAQDCKKFKKIKEDIS